MARRHPPPRRAGPGGRGPRRPRRAVATSGTYERGDHIVDPRTGRAAARPAQPDGGRAAPRLRRRLRDRGLRHGPRRSPLGRDPSRPRGARHHRRRPPGLDRGPGALPGLGTGAAPPPADRRRAAGGRRRPPRRSVDWRRRSGRRGARRSSAAMARPSPVPPPGAPGARQKRSKTWGRSSGRIPGPSSSTPSVRARRVGPDRHRRPDRRGLWRMALSTRIVTSWRSRAGSPVTIAGCGSTSIVTPRVGRGLGHRGRAVGRDVAEVDRHVARGRPRPNRSGPAAAGPRPARSCGRPRRRCRRAPSRPGATGWSWWRLRCSTLLRTTVSGVRSSWLASAANSRWRRSAERWFASDSRIGTRARRA